MDDKKTIRIRYYCNFLKLPTWDTNDLTRYISLYFDDPYSVDFMASKTKIEKLDLTNIANRLIEYLEIEMEKFEKYKIQYWGTPDDMIWLKVYQEMEDILNLDIHDAKQRANIATTNRGCYIIAILIILLLIYFFIF